MVTDQKEDTDVWTDFETDTDETGIISVDNNLVWGAYCPQPDCGELNKFEGKPEKFANRPFRCTECNWVSLMHESVTTLVD